MFADELEQSICVTALQSLYQYHFSPKFEYPGEKHTLYEFFYVLSGNMKVPTDFNTFFLSAGEYIIIPPDVYHSMLPNKGYSLSIGITFDASGVNDNLIALKPRTLSSYEKDCLRTISKTHMDNFSQEGYPFPVQHALRSCIHRQKVI